jgi:hypothetical protein
MRDALGHLLTPALRNARFAINCRAMSSVNSSSEAVVAAYPQQFSNKVSFSFTRTDENGLFEVRFQAPVPQRAGLNEYRFVVRNFGETSEILETFETPEDAF